MYSVNCTPTLVIGKQGENNAEQISVDFAPWLTEYGEGVISARLKRPKDSAAYPVVLTTDGTTATWTVSATDTQYAGAGSLQLVYIVGDVVAKSVIWPVRVLPSLEEGEAPEPYESWLDTLEGLAADTQENARDAADSAADAAQSAQDAAASAQAAADSAASITGLTAVAETLPEGSEASASFDASTDTLTLGIPKGDTGATGPAGPAGPKGDTGADGFSPTITVTEITGGHEVSVTDAEGTQTFNVMDGVSPVLDDEVTEDSANGVKSSGIYDAIVNLLPTDMASGSIASFPDGADDVPMLSLKAQIEPVQDLHGYNSPWPAGGGKNLLNASSATTETKNGVTMTVNKQADGAVTSIIFNGTATANIRFVIGTAILNAGTYVFGALSGGVGVVGTFYVNYSGIVNVGNPEQNYTISEQKTTNISVLIAESVTANNVAYYPMIRPTGADATFAPYSNICPISGRTECVTEVCGKNLFDKTTADEGYIRDTNGEVNGTLPYMHTDYISVVPNATYYVKTEQTSGGWGAWYDSNKTFISSALRWINNTLTAPSNARYVRLTCVSNASGNLDTFAVNYPSTDHEYHAYNGQTYTTTLGRTVYGGTLDVVSGELVIDRAIAVFDGTESGWQWYEGYKQAYISNALSSAPAKYTDDYHVYWNTNALAPIANANRNHNVGNFATAISGGSGVAFSYSADGNLDGFKAFAQANPIQFCYELATPITYHLTPQEVRTFLGQNNLWNDVGDTEVTYRADIQKYIEKKVSA